MLGCAALLLAVVLFGGPPPTSLDSCLAGDTHSLRGFVRHFTPILRYRARLALRRAPSGDSPEQIEDLVQRAFEVLFREDARLLRDYDPERGMSLEGYVGRVATRESQNFVQKLSAAKRGGPGGEVMSDPLDGPIVGRSSPEPNPEDKLHGRERLERLDAALKAQLSAKGQLFYSLMYVEGLDPQEIIDALGVSRDLVYTWRKRIKAAAAQALQQIDAEDGLKPAGGQP